MIPTTGLHLLIPDKPDPEREAVARSFAVGGGTVHRIGRFWEPPALDPGMTRVYGPDSFCLVLQQKLGFALCSPDDGLLLRVPLEFLRRQIVRTKLAEIAPGGFPAFIKPVMPKQFRGAVYASADELGKECHGLAPETEIFMSEPVRLTAEVRSFVLDGSVLDAGIYEGTANVTDAATLVTSLASSISLPRTVVVDVGFIPGRGWVVIEFNAAWGAGLNGCDPDKVLPAIVAASA